MNILLVLSLIAGVVAMVAADCDVQKCLSSMGSVDMNSQDKESICPVMRKTANCLDNVVNTCESLGNNKGAVEGPLKQAKDALKQHCGDGAAGAVAVVTGDCDVQKCIAGMSSINFGDLTSACPDMDTAIKCLENVMNTCQSLGSNRGAVEQPLTQAKENYKKLCGSDGGKSAQENCDVAGCMGQMANVNPEDTEQSCPAMSKAIGCLEKAVNNCQVLGDQKAAIEEPLKEAKKTYKSYCSASGVIQPQYLLIFITVAILSAFYTRL